MDIQELWDKARKRTEILRMRLQDLSASEATTVPYLFLAESSVNPGDTVVRKGHVVIQRPAIVLPNFSPQFDGFGFESDLHVSDDAVATMRSALGESASEMLVVTARTSRPCLRTALTNGGSS